jgi:uroporphyrinogen-III synthase
MLLEAGARVEEIVVYETGRPADVKAESMEVFRTGGIDVIAFASPSAVRNLADALGDAADQVLRRSRAVCIGPTTAEALRELGTDPAAVAREPTLDGLVAAVVEAMRV